MALAIVDLATQTETLRRGEDCTRSFRNPDRRRWVVGTRELWIRDYPANMPRNQKGDGYQEPNLWAHVR